MTDLFIQCRILYNLYDSFNKREQVSIEILRNIEFEHLPVEEFESELSHLMKDNYLSISKTGNLDISSLGIRTIEFYLRNILTIFGKIMRRNYPFI
jgi:hypothetical protein